MTFLLLLMGLLFAQAPEEESDAEITVIGEYEVNKKLRKLNKELRQMGYRSGKEKNGKITYIPEISWKPTIIVDRNGLVELKRTKPRFESYVDGRRDNKLRYLACIPPFTIMCIKMGGWLVGKRKLQHAKTKVILNTQQSVKDWQEAIQAQAMSKRLLEDLPDTLTTIWENKQRG